MGFGSAKWVPWSTDLFMTGSSLPSTNMGMCLTFECCSGGGGWGWSWWFCPLILASEFTVRWSGGADTERCALSSASTTLGSAALFWPRSTVFLSPYWGRVCASCEGPASCSVCVAAVCCLGDCGWGEGGAGNVSSREPNLLFQWEGKCSLKSGGMSSKGNLSKPPKLSAVSVTKICFHLEQYFL